MSSTKGSAPMTRLWLLAQEHAVGICKMLYLSRLILCSCQGSAEQQLMQTPLKRLRPSSAWIRLESSVLSTLGLTLLNVGSEKLLA